MHGLVSTDYLWLAQALLTALMAGLLFSLIIGLLLLVRPEIAFAIGARLNRWIDTSELFRKLEQPRSSERLFYRHHRLVGAVVSLGASFVLWQWLVAVPRATAQAFFLGRHASRQWDWIAPAVDWLVVGLHAFVLPVGIVIFLRPSLLKNLEKTANQWHQVPGAAPLDAVVARLDDGFALHPRLGGLILVVAAGACLLALAMTVLPTLGHLHR